MPVTLSPLAGAAQQFFDNNGNPLSGGKLWSYQAGTTTPQTTYTDSAGAVAHTNPIILDSAGRVPTGEIWLTINQTYKFVLTTSGDVTLATWDNITGSGNIAQVDYSPATTSLLYPGPLTVKSALDQITNRTTGSSLIGFLQTGPGSVGTTVQTRLRETFSVKDFGAVGDGVADDTAAIQTAINAAIAASLAIGNYSLARVFLPAGIYKISSTIKTQGSPTTGQCALTGAGQFLTVIRPTGDFTAINLATAYIDSGDFSVEWPVTAAASMPATRIGIEFAAADRQVSQNEIRNIQVRYAYRGFVLNNWTGSPFGTMWMCRLNRLSTYRCADYGFYLNSKTGSTTLHLDMCYVAGQDSATLDPYGKGFFVNNFDDVLMTECAIDTCLDTWVYVTNATQTNIKNIAFESDKLSDAALYGMFFQSANVIIDGIAVKVCTFDTGGNARVIYAAGTTLNMSIMGYREAFTTVVAGTTVYKAAIGSAASDVFIQDDTIQPGETFDNGNTLNFVYRGTRVSRNGTIPSYGTWLRGDYVRNGNPAVGSPKGWYCTVAGTPGTWVSEGNL